MTNFVNGPSADIRIKKLTGAQMVNVAAAHNKRERWSQQSTNSQCSTAKVNEVVCGPFTATDVAADARQKIHQAGITKIRKNAVFAIELIATLKSGTGTDEHAFFIDCLNWVAAGQAISVLAFESHLTAIAASTLAQGKPLIDIDRSRLLVAAGRIQHIAQVYA